MSPLHAVILGIIQGVTEFLPVSSSAHLYVIPTLLGWRYEGVAFDVALHWGTLLALVLAYGRDWWKMFTAAFAGDRAAIGLLVRIAVATVPAAIAGVLLKDLAETMLRSLPLQAAMLFLFGFLLWAVDRFRPPGRDDDAPGWAACLAIGCAQVLALVPGVSRSGITITAGRGAGLSRVSAARFSFLLAMPITFGAGLLELRHLPHDVPMTSLALGVITAAVVGWLAIRGLIRWLSHAGLGIFFVYRAAFAAFILWRVLSAKGAAIAG